MWDYLVSYVFKSSQERGNFIDPVTYLKQYKSCQDYLKLNMSGLFEGGISWSNGNDPIPENKEHRLKLKWPQILTILTPKDVVIYICLTLHLPLLAGVFEYKTRVVHTLIIKVETCWALTIRSLPKLVEVKIAIIWLKARKVRSIRPFTDSGTSALHIKVMRRHQVNRRTRYRFLLNWRTQNFLLHRRDKRLCYLKRILPQ